MRFGGVLAVVALAGNVLAADGVRQALLASVPMSESDSIVSLTRFSATRLGVNLIDLDTDKKHNQWTELTPEAMQRVLEAASIEGLPVKVEDLSALSSPPPANSVPAEASVRRPAEKPDFSTASDPVESHPDSSSNKNRLAYEAYQTLLSTYVYGTAIPLAYGVTNPRFLIAIPLITAPVAFGTQVWLSHDLDFTEAQFKGTTYFPSLAIYAATALPLAFSGGDYRTGYRVASLLGAAAYPLGIWYGYHLGDVYQSDPDQLDVKFRFALGYAFLGFVTPSLYYEHPGDQALRLGLGQSVGMAVVGDVVADYYRPSSNVTSGVQLGVFTHAFLGGLGGLEFAALNGTSTLRPWLGAALIGSSLGYTEGLFFFHSSNDDFDRARYGLLGGLGGAMIGSGLQLILYDGSASAHEQRIGWSSSVIGGAWLGYWTVYLLTSKMKEAVHAEAPSSKPSALSSWAFDPLPMPEPILSRGDVAMGWRVPGFSCHF